jgi:hypothetical protein
MSHLAFRRPSLFAAALLLTGWLSGHLPDAAVRAQEKQDDILEVTVVHEDRSLPPIVTVELYQDGKLLRSRELNFSSTTEDKVVWRKLKPGRYEVHFEGRGYKTLVKRFTLVEGDTGYKIRVELDKDQAVVIGSGVSLAEMQKELEATKKKVAALEAEVEKLKKK